MVAVKQDQETTHQGLSRQGNAESARLGRRQENERDPHAFFAEAILAGQPSLDDYRTLARLLWESYGQSVFLYARARMRNVEDAREISQDAFVKAMQWLQSNPGGKPAKINFPAWLQRITKHLVIDFYRSPKLFAALPSEPDYGNGGAQLADWPDPRTVGPLDRAVRGEELAALRSAIEQLREGMRRMVILRDVQGLSNTAIAEQLGIPASTVAVTLHRARKKLRESLDIFLTPRC